ncbi:hypothetical protein FRC00_009054 [Tulasnella sp. 408]|nr:hypothetical protein FRC00_009054 [Tulasnella sp. 408]
MSTHPNVNIPTKRKAGSSDISKRKQKKARKEQKDLIKEAKALKQCLEQLPEDRRNGLGFVAGLILDGEPYHPIRINLLEIPIPEPTESPEQSTDLEKLVHITDLANKHRARVAELHRSAPKDSSGEMSVFYCKNPLHLGARALLITGPGLARNQDLLYAIEDKVLYDAERRYSLVSRRAEHPVNIGRPFDTTGASISIYHPVFSKFTTRIKDHNVFPSAEDVVTAYELMVMAAEVHSSETAYLKDIWPRINRLIGDRAITRSPWDYPCKPEGVLFHKVDTGTAPFLVVHTKSEIGTTGLDLTDQAAFSFHELWALSSQTSEIRNACCCPSFVLSLAGPHLTIYGGVVADKFILQPLTEMLGLANFPDPFGRAQYIAKIMTVFRSCLEDLESFYNTLVPAEDPELAPLIPAFREYGEDKKVTLTYATGNLLSNRVGRAMFSAKAKQPGEEEGTPVLVRFTARYGREAHALLAEKGLAPQILHYEVLENGWAVVVMDFVDGLDLDSAGVWVVPSGTLEDVQEALRVLHKENLVFGDLRRPNIIVCKRDVPGGGTTLGGMLVDFDWAGKHDEQRYPPMLNPGFKWAEGIKGGGLMKKEHDIAMFSLLVGQQ